MVCGYFLFSFLFSLHILFVFFCLVQSLLTEVIFSDNQLSVCCSCLLLFLMRFWCCSPHHLPLYLYFPSCFLSFLWALSNFFSWMLSSFNFNLYWFWKCLNYGLPSNPIILCPFFLWISEHWIFTLLCKATIFSWLLLSPFLSCFWIPCLSIGVWEFKKQKNPFILREKMSYCKISVSHNWNLSDAKAALFVTPLEGHGLSWNLCLSHTSLFSSVSLMSNFSRYQ